jgi:hypothetical protein
MLTEGQQHPLRHFPDFRGLARAVKVGFSWRKNPLSIRGFGLHQSGKCYNDSLLRYFC